MKTTTCPAIHGERSEGNCQLCGSARLVHVLTVDVASAAELGIPAGIQNRVCCECLDCANPEAGDRPEPLIRLPKQRAAHRGTPAFLGIHSYQPIEPRASSDITVRPQEIIKAARRPPGQGRGWVRFLAALIVEVK